MLMKKQKKRLDFPIERSHYAKLLDIVSKDSPRYIILKFFYDQRKEGDEVLINEIKKHENIFTQAFSYVSEEGDKN